MAKKKSSSVRKTPVTNKKTASSAKKRTNTIKKFRAAQKMRKVMLKKIRITAGLRMTLTALNSSGLICSRKTLLINTIEGLQSIMEDFRDVSQNYLNAIQRRRKIGAGIKNYGFIEKVADLSETNSQFANFFRPEDLKLYPQL